jgi:hypothetical protein
MTSLFLRIKKNLVRIAPVISGWHSLIIDRDFNPFLSMSRQFPFHIFPFSGIPDL